MSRGLGISTRSQAIAFWSAGAIFGGVTLYDLYWFWIDTLARLGMLPDGIAGFDIHGWIAIMPVSSNLFFYGSLGCKVIGLGLLALGSRLAIHALGISIIFHAIDWVGLSGNAYYDGSIDGTISMALQSLAMIPLIYLLSSQGLRE